MTGQVAVIGAGVVGLATAWALERRGLHCSVFEQGAPGGGQSAGESRIFRHAHRDPRQFELALRARRDWRDWEEAFGVQLISPDGSMVLGEDAVSRLERYADEPGIEVRELTPEEIREVLPPMDRFDGPAMIDETAGAIRTRLALANLIRAVGTNLIPERVEAVLPRITGGVEVVTENGSRTFDSAVVCAGRGTSFLAEASGVPIPVTDRAHVRLCFPVDGAGRERRLACFQDSSGFWGEDAGYGSAVRGNREYTVGLAVSASMDATAADSLDDLTARTLDYARRAMPGLSPWPAQALHCWVTELPWAPDGLAIWQSADTFFVAGHNLFKLAPVLGRALARSVASGEVEPGFRPEDRLGASIGEPAGSAG
ncbi:MAG: FAD-binding oxidoreductase [Solirubrobacterales bacterium]|nr:FAD-binding oxidoreductase [Solirubrobacterales bacterium]